MANDIATIVTKRKSVQHNVLMDLTQTLGHVLKTHLPDQLGKVPIDVCYELPDSAALEKLKKGQLKLSVVLVDATRNRSVQSAERPIVREEDEDGGLTEYRTGAPTHVFARYLVTPWAKDPLDAQVALGAIMQHFFSFPIVDEQDYQGVSLLRAGQLAVELDPEAGMPVVMGLFQGYGRPYQASLIFRVDLVMESIFRVPVRRVTEKVNIYRKVES